MILITNAVIGLGFHRLLGSRQMVGIPYYRRINSKQLLTGNLDKYQMHSSVTIESVFTATRPFVRRKYWTSKIRGFLLRKLIRANWLGTNGFN